LNNVTTKQKLSVEMGQDQGEGQRVRAKLDSNFRQRVLV
jgi:hypothetical protein